MTAPVYDPSTPVIPQNHDFDCAEQSTLWAMTAYGRHPSDAWMEASMLTSGIESTDLGLLVADGSQLAAWITEQYGEFNYSAYNNGHVSFDDIRSVAGQTPVIVGGRQWNHWSGVRGYDQATDTLQLANPADGWMNVSQSMTRQQFDALGPFSMVVITWTDPAPPVVVPPAPPPEPAPMGYVVGSGILNAMTNVGEWPTSDEVHHGDQGRGYAEAYSNLGRRWTWIDSLGLVVVSEGWKGQMEG